MLTQVPLLIAQAAGGDHDAGVRHVAQISARLAYATMCATLCWGVLMHVPELEAGGCAIARATVRELLGHQSGSTRDGAHADFWQLEQPLPL